MRGQCTGLARWGEAFPAPVYGKPDFVNFLETLVTISTEIHIGGGDGEYHLWVI
jgi:hypothetical protein